MTETLAELLNLAPATIFLAAIIFARVGAAVSVLPGFGEQSIPARVKLGAALAFAALVASMIWPDVKTQIGDQSWIALLITESLVGLTLGIALRFLIIALQIAGTIASQSMSLSQLFGGGLGTEPQPAFSTLLVIAGIALATLAGLHVQIVAMFALSYELFPVGSLMDPQDIAAWGSGHAARMFGLGLTLAAPFVLAATIYNVGLGFISRAMPQLMVAFVGAPAISLAGLFLLLLASPLMLTVWWNVFAEQISAPNLGFR